MRSDCGGTNAVGILEDYVSVDSLPPCMWCICFDIGVGLRITCFACMLITIGDSTSTDYVVQKQGIRGSNASVRTCPTMISFIQLSYAELAKIAMQCEKKPLYFGIF